MINAVISTDAGQVNSWKVRRRRRWQCTSTSAELQESITEQIIEISPITMRPTPQSFNCFPLRQSVAQPRVGIVTFILRGQVCDRLIDKSSLVNQAEHLQCNKQTPWVSETLRLTSGNQPTHGVESRTPPWTTLHGVDIIASLCWQRRNGLFLNRNRIQIQSKQWERK